MEPLDDEGRVALRRIVLRLADPDEPGDDLRRVATIGEVAPDATAARVLALLVERRLVIVDGDDVEVAHEALLREWPRLRDWLDADRRARRFQHGLAAAAKAWADAGREPEMLLRGPRLAAALDTAAALEADASGSRGHAQPLDRAYLAESESVAGSELRDARRTARRLASSSVQPASASFWLWSPAWWPCSSGSKPSPKRRSRSSGAS